MVLSMFFVDNECFHVGNSSRGSGVYAVPMEWSFGILHGMQQNVVCELRHKLCADVAIFDSVLVHLLILILFVEESV